MSNKKDESTRRPLSLKAKAAPEVEAPRIEERLHKVLAQAGLGSRRALEQRIADGLVKVNGETAQTGMSVKAGDKIELDGKTFVASALTEPARVLIYNKPEGEVTTREDPEGRPTIFEALPALKGARWIAIGRLDINTTGLLLLTTDGELANGMMHPSFEVEREYVCRVRAPEGEDAVSDKIVDRDLGGFIWPNAWFQSVNSIAIIALAPIIAWIWIKLGRANPNIPRKFGLGIIFNGLAFLLLMFALSSLIGENGKIPFWTLFMVYVIQSVGELCLSPIGLSMTTKLAPTKLVGFAMGGWFLSTGIGNNLSGIFASSVSGEEGMTVASAQAGYTFGFWVLIGAGVLLFLIAPLIQRWMHGVK